MYIYTKDDVVGSERLDSLLDEHQECLNDGYEMVQAYMKRLNKMIEVGDPI